MMTTDATRSDDWEKDSMLQYWIDEYVRDVENGIKREHRRFIEKMIRRALAPRPTPSEDWEEQLADLLETVTFWTQTHEKHYLLPRGIYLRSHYEEDTGYYYNTLLDLTTEEMDWTTEDIDSMCIGPFPPAFFERPRALASRPTVDVEGLKSSDLLAITPTPQNWFWCISQQEVMRINWGRWFDANGVMQVFLPDEVFIPLPSLTNNENQNEHL